MNVKRRGATKIIALILSLVLVVSMAPMSIFISSATSTGALSIVDSNNNPLENAIATLTTKRDSESVDIFSSDKTSDENGEIKVSEEFAAYFAANPTAEIEFTVEVQKEGYRQGAEYSLVVKADTDSFGSIEMVRQFKVSVSANLGGADCYVKTADETKYYGENSFDEGTALTLVTSDVEHYSKSATLGGESIDLDSDGEYVFTVDSAKVFAVTYEAVKYSVKLTVDENGTVTPSEDGIITVDKTTQGTELTITPNEHFELADILLNDTSVKADVTENNYVYTYLLKAEDIDDNESELTVTFAKRMYSVSASVDQEKGGTVELSATSVEAESDVTVTFKPDAGYSLFRVTVNGAECIDEVTDNILTFAVTQDNTEIVAFYDVIDTETLKDVDINTIFTISDAQYIDDIYYAKDKTITKMDVTAKDTVTVEDTPVVTNITKMDAIVNDTNTYGGEKKTYEITENTNLSSVQVFAKEGFGRKAYLCTGTFKLRFDTQKPIIVSIADFAYTNKDHVIDVVINDPVENFLNEDFASGVDWDSVTIERTYGSTTEPVTFDKANKQFTAEKLDNQTVDVTYTINVKDKVGNAAEAVTFTVKNDDEAPSLIDSEEAVKFELKNTSTFAVFLNEITFGKWFNKTLTATFTVEDKGVGFDNNNSKAVLVLKNGSDVVFTSADATINEDGKATVKIDVSDTEIYGENPVFQGKVYYSICDALGNSSGETLVTNTVSNILSNDSPVVMIEEVAPYTSDAITLSPVVTDPPRSATDIPYDFDSDTLVFNENATASFSIADDNSGIYGYDITVNGVSVANATNVTKDKLADTQSDAVTITADVKDGDVVKKLGFVIDTSKGDLKPNEDGAFIVEIVSITDNSGNKVEKTEEKDILSQPFCVDRTAPQITDFNFNSSKEGEAPVIFEDPDYGFFFKTNVQVDITAVDQTSTDELVSGVKAIKVYLVGEYLSEAGSATGAKKIYSFDEKGDLVEKTIAEAATYLSKSNSYSFTQEVTVPANFKGQIFAYAVDNVNNDVLNAINRPTTTEYPHVDGFVHPEGTVVETGEMHRENSGIGITMPKTKKTQNNTFEKKQSQVKVPGAQPDKVMDYSGKLKNPVALYNQGQTFNVTVSDTFSGIQNVKYYVFEGDYTIGSQTAFGEVEVDLDGTLSDDTWTAKKEKEDTIDETNLVVELSKDIDVDGNYNDMVLLVVLTDRAGNVSYDYVAFGIDHTAPVITVEYSNNSVDSTKYFNDDRIATVTIQERNFNKENVKWSIKNTEGKAPAVKYLGGTPGTGNRDNDTYTFQISYDYDGKFLFDVSYTDRAGNANEKVNYLEQPAPQDFVIDKTQPKITVSYDNNSAQNEKYFKNHRTATIVIEEHNFDPSRVDWTKRTAANPATAVPGYSYVGQNGDTYTYTIAYDYDGDFTFDISMLDLAGNKNTEVNYGSSVAPKDFTVDTTYQDIVKIEGINPTGTVLGLDKSTGKIDAGATIRVTINDTNLQDYKLTLYRTRVNINGESKNEKVETVFSDKNNINKDNINKEPSKSNIENNVDVTANFIKNASGSANTVVEFSIPERTEGVVNDGLYTLHVEASDKAGNTYEDACKSSSDKSVDNVFSVNRHGSVYVISNNFYHVLSDNDGYFDTLKDDIEIVEYNPDSLSKTSIEYLTSNGATTLKESKTNNAGDVNTYTKSVHKDDNMDWYEYTYKLNKAAFTKDGDYSVSLTSNDVKKAPSMSDNYKILKSNFKFVVDTKAPVLESIEVADKDVEVNKATGGNGRVSADKLNINFKVSDAAHLDKVEVMVDGEVIKTYQYTDQKKVKSGDVEYFQDKDVMEGSFVLEGKSSLDPQNYQIVAYDKTHNNTNNDTAIKARHVLDTNAESFDFSGYNLIYNKLIVSTNWFIQFYASVAGWVITGVVAAAIAGTAAFIIIKKRKKNATPAEEAK
ncbi:MAG: hypothetical protein E7517_00040 [Ruminococcaceae bacterium]|nr:hypothetical protein [Oscillospiraceae bacterium]